MHLKVTVCVTIGENQIMSDGSKSHVTSSSSLLLAESCGAVNSIIKSVLGLGSTDIAT